MPERKFHICSYVLSFLTPFWLVKLVWGLWNWIYDRGKNVCSSHVWEQRRARKQLVSQLQDTSLIILTLEVQRLPPSSSSASWSWNFNTMTYENYANGSLCPNSFLGEGLHYSLMEYILNHPPNNTNLIPVMYHFQKQDPGANVLVRFGCWWGLPYRIARWSWLLARSSSRLVLTTE